MATFSLPGNAGWLWLVLLLAFSGLASRGAPSDWAGEIDELTSADAVHPPPHNGIVFVGSSSIRLWTTLATDFPNLPVINRGFGGSKLTDCIYYEDRIVLDYHPHTVVLYAGENDLWNGKSPQQVVSDFDLFRTRLHTELPQTLLIFLSIKESPSRYRVHEQVRHANALLAADCALDKHCLFVDVDTPMLAAGKPRPELFGADQLHMKPEGYAIWTQALRPLLKP